MAEQPEDVKALDRELQGLTQVHLKEEPDPRVLIPRIYGALSTLGMLDRRAAVTKVKFQLEPDPEDAGWVFSASVDVYGELKNDYPEHLETFTLRGDPKDRYGDAVLSLQKAVKRCIDGKLFGCEQDMVSLRVAATDLETSLQGLWAEEDPED